MPFGFLSNVIKFYVHTYSFSINLLLIVSYHVTEFLRISVALIFGQAESVVNRIGTELDVMKSKGCN